MKRDEIYKELYRYSAAALAKTFDDTNAFIEIGADEDDCSFYYDTMEHLKDLLIHLLSFQKFFDDLFWKMALTPNADPEAQAEAEHEIAWRLEKMRRRIQDLEDGTIF